MRPVEEYDSQDICPGREEEGGRGGRLESEEGSPSRNLFLLHSEDLPYDCYSVLTTPVEPVQCWSASGAHAGLLGVDCLVESLHMYIKELEHR